MPLDTDTAKASSARLTAIRKISTKPITCLQNIVRRVKFIIAYLPWICYNQLEI